jgi:hypothetical protein
MSNSNLIVLDGLFIKQLISGNIELYVDKKYDLQVLIENIVNHYRLHNADVYFFESSFWHEWLTHSLTLPTKIGLSCLKNITFSRIRSFGVSQEAALFIEQNYDNYKHVFLVGDDPIYETMLHKLSQFDNLVLIHYRQESGLSDLPFGYYDIRKLIQKKD